MYRPILVVMEEGPIRILRLHPRPGPLPVAQGPNRPSQAEEERLGGGFGAGSRRPGLVGVAAKPSPVGGREQNHSRSLVFLFPLFVQIQLANSLKKLEN